MKKILVIGSLVAMVSIARAQDYTDAVRYSEHFNLGDARYSAMGGAFSALGNNHSAILDNPAAIGVFKGASFEFSLNNGMNLNKTTFLGTTQQNRAYLFNGNVGLLFKVDLPKNELNAKYINFSYTCNRVNDFKSNSGFNVYNNSSSLTDDLLYDAQHNNINNVGAITYNALNTGLIYQDKNKNLISDFIHNDSLGNTIYGPYGLTQIQKLVVSGRINENSFGMGSNFNDKFYLGGSLNISTLEYTEKDSYSEIDSKDVNPTFNSFNYTRTIKDKGTGISFKMGLIAIPVKDLRIALSYHSPTVWTIDRETPISMDFSYPTNNSSHFDTSYVYSYNLYSPGKVVAGLAYTIKKTLLLSADYEFQKYTNAMISSSDNYDYTSVNNDISKNARIINNLKFGAELRLGPVSLRGGAAFYQSPYSYYADGFKDYRVSYSGGIGLKNENFYIDMAVVNTSVPSYRYIYTDNAGTTLHSTSKSNITNVILTVGLKY